MAKAPRDKKRLAAGNVRLAIITSEFNADVTDRMRDDALAEAAEHGAKVTVDVRVPGVYDMPLLVHEVMDRKDVDAVVVLGAVISGGTKHDELITRTTALALTVQAVQSHKPVGLGITGPGQTHAQAVARIDRANWAVKSVLKQLQTLRSLRKHDAGAG